MRSSPTIQRSASTCSATATTFGLLQRARWRRQLRLLRVRRYRERAGHDDQQHAQAAHRSRKLHVHAEREADVRPELRAHPQLVRSAANRPGHVRYYIESAFGSPRTVVQNADGTITGGMLLGNATFESLSAMISRSSALRAMPTAQVHIHAGLVVHESHHGGRRPHAGRWLPAVPEEQLRLVSRPHAVRQRRAVDPKRRSATIPSTTSGTFAPSSAHRRTSCPTCRSAASTSTAPAIVWPVPARA